MKPLARLGTIVGGYLLALLLACSAVALHVAATDSPDRQASAGMASFGDAFLFLSVFGLASLPPSALALGWLRRYRWFWLGLIAVGAVASATTLISLIAYLGWRADTVHPLAQWLSMLAPLRMLFAPMLAVFLIASAVCAPSRRLRLAFGIAALVEVLSFAGFVLALIGSGAR